MHLMQHDKHSRRDFLRRSGHLALMGAAAPLGLNLAAMGEAAAFNANDYKALVCVFLFGGNDHANTVVAYDNASHADYARIRAAGAGIGAFFSPTGYGTELAKNGDGSARETREINGKHYVLEMPIHADVALIKAEQGDRWGNLTYRMAARNFGPVMAMAAKKTIASVHEIVELGAINPESIVTPGIFVHRIVKIDRVATQAGGFKKAA